MSARPLTSLLAVAVLGSLLTLANIAQAQAQAPDDGAPALDAKKYEDPGEMPDETQHEAQVTDRTGNQLPLDATFDAEDGSKVSLGDLLKPGRPLLLQFAYYKCAGLCTVTISGAVDLLKTLDLEPGRDFEVVTVSINPQETPNLARDKKANTMQELGRPEAFAPWHFLTGSRAQIEALTEAAGFGYRFNTETREFAHGAALFVVTPEGKISRTIFGALYETRTVRLSLIEAADGKIGTPLDRILLYCYLYDPSTGKYTAVVMNIVRLVSLVSVLLMGAMMGTFFWKEHLERRRTADDTNTPARQPEAAGDTNTPARQPEAAGDTNTTARQPEEAGDTNTTARQPEEAGAHGGDA